MHAAGREMTIRLHAAAAGRVRRMLARMIGVTSALNRHVGPEYDPDLKMPHWGKRKLKRDR